MSEIEHDVQQSYTKVDGAVYPFPHDPEEHERLSLQSNHFLRAYDNQILYAPVNLTDEDWVLDIGTGTGIWLQDLAKRTSAKPHYVGADIESALFPDPSTLPANMRFEVHNVTNLPTEWTNKFVVVHQRLLVAALREHEWLQAISEIYRVLKPGGWVQLFEREDGISGPTFAKYLEMVYKISDKQGTMWHNITKRLPDFMQEIGFINLHKDARKTPLGTWAGQDGAVGKKNLLSAMRRMKTPLLTHGGFGVVHNEAEYNQLLEEISKELDITEGSGVTWVMFWAQKPE